MIRSTTIVAVRRDGCVAMGGDGQVTMEQTIVKHSARKIRRMYQNRVLAGFAGSVADAQALADEDNLGDIVDPSHPRIADELGIECGDASRLFWIPLRNHVKEPPCTSARSIW